MMLLLEFMLQGEVCTKVSMYSRMEHGNHLFFRFQTALLSLHDGGVQRDDVQQSTEAHILP